MGSIPLVIRFMEQEILMEFVQALLLRTPYLGFQAFALDKLQELLGRRDFQNALFLASPEFYRVLEKKRFDAAQLDEKALFSLGKYYNRMSFRPTPFGAFAAFTLLHWGEGRGIRLAEKWQSRLHLYPSRSWQIAAAAGGGPDPRLLRKSPTLYRLGAVYRYIRWRSAASGKLEFAINEIAAEELHVALLTKMAQAALSAVELTGWISAQTGVTLIEAADYLEFLVGEQVLLSSAEMGLLEENPGLHQEDKREGRPRGIADKFWQEHRVLPWTRALSLADLAEEVRGHAAANAFLVAGNLFYSALERPLQLGEVPVELQSRLLAGLGALHHLAPPPGLDNLRDFVTAFQNRFEAQKVPLLLAMDPDAGIRYGGLHSPGGEGGLLDKLPLSPGKAGARQLDWTMVHLLLMRTWLHRTGKGVFDPVVLGESDLEGIRVPAGLSLPPSMAVVFSRTSEGLLIESAGGASATALIGRFTLFSAEVHGLALEVARSEAANNPEVIFAEIHQLSDAHVDNINRRKAVYDYVLSLNTYPFDAPQNIALDDLVLYVREGELILESLSLQKRVIPRLPTAYNYRHNQLALFQLLGDLQYQGLRANLSFDPEQLFPGMDFYPRIVYGEVILSLAKWYLREQELRALTAAPFSLGRLHAFRQERGISRRVMLGAGDQQLVFDLVDDRQALFFLNCLRGTTTAVLREYLYPETSVKADQEVFAAQFIALLQNTRQVYQAAPVREEGKGEAQRRFLTGSEWLYLKIYCTEESADRILTRIIYPVLEHRRGLIKSWFFVRYYDPEPHLRLRIRTDPEHIGVLLRDFETQFEDPRQEKLIRSYQTDTYQREIERYGADLIGAVETVFHAGSELVLSQLMGRQEEAGSPDRDGWAFAIAYRMSAAFLPAEDELAAFWAWRSASFLEEFGGGKALKVGLDQKYREIRELLRASQEDHVGDAYGHQVELLLERLRTIAGESAGLESQRKNALLADLVHMQVNRSFPFRQRAHELLVSYCLHKFCLSDRARKTRA